MEKKRHADIPINWDKVNRRIHKMEGVVDYDDDDSDDDDEEGGGYGGGGGSGGQGSEQDTAIDFDHCEHMDVYTNIYVAKWLASQQGNFMEEMMKQLEKFGQRTGLGAGVKKMKELLSSSGGPNMTTAQLFLPMTTGIKGFLGKSFS